LHYVLLSIVLDIRFVRLCRWPIVKQRYIYMYSLRYVYKGMIKWCIDDCMHAAWVDDTGGISLE